MATVYLALGSNVGDRRDYIEQAVEQLRPALEPIKVAPLYLTQPMGYADQTEFVNTALKGQTELTPRQLLRLVKKIETKVGRVRRFHWGPREIDIDIIFYDDVRVNESDLIIPHPRLAERDFVLAPLCDLDPDYVDPLSGQTIKQLLDQLAPEQRMIVSKVT